MSSDDDIDSLKSRRICFACVGENFLSDEIRGIGKRRKCSYCGSVSRCYSIEQMSQRIEETFEEHYVRTSDQPSSYQSAMLADKEFEYEWEREGEPVVYAIMNAADIPEEAASDIQEILADKYYVFDKATFSDESEFSGDSHYEESSTNDERWQDEWREFERSLKSEARFFSRSASTLLTSIFDKIDMVRTRDDRSMIVDAGPGTELSSVFRARSFQSDDDLKIALVRPDIHVGSPPAAHASAGRMNARGISVFYGANDPKVALAEVRPPVGSKVVVARFEIIRPIRLLDLTALNAAMTPGSIFDPTFTGRLERTMFLRNLSRRITVPVMPDDETFEYLATQAIADFLATENNPPLDGIIFPSVQTGGKALNCVLFHKAARVEEIELPIGTEISSRLGSYYEEGWEDDFVVTEEVPPQKDETESQQKDFFESMSFFDDPDVRRDFNAHPSTLKVDLECVHVHIVEAVHFTTKKHSVSRHRWEKHEPEF